MMVSRVTSAERLEFAHLLKEYPKYIGKEQMRVICKISPRKAQYLLEKGLVPCINSGKKTRQYKIAVSDVINYLVLREKFPDKYAHRTGRNANANCEPIIVPPEIMHAFFMNELKDYPDVLTTNDVVRLTEYSINHVTAWCAEGRLNSFKYQSRYMIPKAGVLEFLQTPEFRRNRIKSKRLYQYLVEYYQDNYADAEESPRMERFYVQESEISSSDL